MLQKRIDFTSIPYGFAIAGEDLTKGDAVIIKIEAGVEKAYRPTTQAEADAVLGFVTFRIEEQGKADKDFDVLKAGSRVVIYTLVKNNMWATTQFIGALVKGDQLVVDFTPTDKGKLRKITAGEITATRKVQFELFDKQDAGSGYTDAMAEVWVK